MSEWVLILTLLYAGQYATVQQVEFHSKEACQTAARLWLDQRERLYDRVESFAVPAKGAFCVPR